jgi:hypothetical protein
MINNDSTKISPLVHIGVIGMVISSLYLGYSARTEELTPRDGRCLQTMDDDCWSVAMEYEIKFLHTLAHETRESLSCTADVGGHLVQYRSSQVWVKRCGEVPKLRH